jgi:hypothetical protein
MYTCRIKKIEKPVYDGYSARIRKEYPMANEQVKTTLSIILMIADAIEELGSVPSGHLYAQICMHLNLDDYNDVISVLVNAGLVKEENHLLTWIGDK